MIRDAGGISRQDKSLVDLGVTMPRSTWKLSWNDRFGGILCFHVVLGKPFTEYWHDMKFWWGNNLSSSDPAGRVRQEVRHIATPIALGARGPGRVGKG